MPVPAGATNVTYNLSLKTGSDTVNVAVSVSVAPVAGGPKSLMLQASQAAAYAAMDTLAAAYPSATPTLTRQWIAEGSEVLPYPLQQAAKA